MSALDELSRRGWCCTALERSLGLSALRSRFGPAWRFLVSTEGEWWATAGTSRHWAGEPAARPDAVSAHSPAELAAVLSAGSAT